MIIRNQVAEKRRGGRKVVRHGGTLCSDCLEVPPATAKTRRCRPCHAAYEKARRARIKAALIAADGDTPKLAAIVSDDGVPSSGDGGPAQRSPSPTVLTEAGR
jgi:hypothetical protein